MLPPQKTMRRGRPAPARARTTRAGIPRPGTNAERRKKLRGLLIAAAALSLYVALRIALESSPRLAAALAGAVLLGIVLTRIFIPSVLPRFRAAKHLGLRWKGHGWLLRGAITGELHGFSVTVRDEIRSLRERIEVVLRSVPSSMKILPMEAIRGQSLAGRVETGDEDFDAHVFIEGVPSWQILPSLDAPTRALARQLVGKEGFAIQDGRLFRVEDKPTSDSQVLEDILLDVTKLCQALVTTSRAESAEGLARMAREDPDHHVRRRCLQILSGFYPDLPLTLATCREALQDASPWVELQAAMGLGHEGVERLQQMIDHTTCPDSIVAPGLQHLVSIAPDKAISSLLAALKTSNLCARRFAAETLGHMQHLPALGPLGTLVETADEGTAVVAAEALGAIHSSDAEPSLVHALARQMPDVQQAAARALGRVGTVEAVPALRSLAETGGGSVRSAARDAVRAIQARLSGAEAGLLAVAGTDAVEGQLSLASERRGQVSLTGRSGPRRSTAASE